MIVTLQDLATKLQDPEFAAQLQVDAGKPVTTVAEYFQVLDRLKNTNHWPLYVRLPFSEPFFTINANTRVINVPTEFRNNGIAVAGDHLAEILYFEVNRFYDTTDLALCGENGITIQWVAGDAKGVDTAYALDYDEDRLIFGWIISGLVADKIGPAAKAGQVEFAINFQIKDGTTVVFNMNTVSAKVQVKNSIGVDYSNVSPDTAEWKNIVKNRPVYTGLADMLDAALASITLNLFQGDADLGKKNQHPDGDVTAVELVDNADATKTVMNIEGTSVDILPVPDGEDTRDRQAEVVYKWEFNGAAIGEGTTSGDAANSRFLANPELGDAELVAEGSIVVDAPVYDAASRTAAAKVTSNVPGVYQAYIGNKVRYRNKDTNGNLLDSYQDPVTRWSLSNVTTIPWASGFDITVINLPERAVLAVAANNQTGAGAPRAFLSQPLEVAVPNANGAVTYQWKLNGVEIAGATGAALAVENIVEDGIYSVEITNTLNNSKVVKSIGAVDIKKMPTPPADYAIAFVDGKIIATVVAGRHYLYEIVAKFIPNAIGANDVKLDIPSTAIVADEVAGTLTLDITGWLNRANNTLRRADGTYNVLIRVQDVIFEGDPQNQATSIPQSAEISLKYNDQVNVLSEVISDRT
jgi:hypothetical protein